ncbi:hypothetical protein [Armatimonas rosea]|uniref:Uncharacterized protein n=1 Tax=Armatimonas rosea TaxID=685828 RepID=A0A7W9SLG0_ARMRO|nr:hypothetical protein [Armatimonas rosea]MBB6048816.1 hypothetical protein [Armatimonas rosea]
MTKIEPIATWTTREAAFVLGASGAWLALARRRDGRSYVAPGQPAPVLQVRVAGKLHAPETARWDGRSRRLTLGFGTSGVSATLAIQAKPTHLMLELVEVTPKETVELVVWGPYPTVIGETIGEIVGVVRDAETALGIQALNAKTLGGFPGQESDIEPDYTADDTGTYPDLPDALKKDQLFRGDTARRTAFGSVVQAYCRSRVAERVIPNWGIEKFPAPAFDDGGMVGSKLALFLCPAAKALDTIGAIEVAEGLPHPLLDGVWAKKSPRATDSYLIVDFSEATIDRAIEMTLKAGLRYLYHSSPFETWGHFRLKPSLFPHGVAGLRECVERAKKAGVRVGFHTLSNFLTPNDPYVTPRPDPRLARSGRSTLTAGVSPTQTELPIADPEPFLKKTALSTVALGDELIRYESVSPSAPWRLLGCQRGAWGTQAAAHASQSTIGKLLDHDYKVFLTDASLTQEVAKNIAALCNQAGTLQISLDGLEGNWSTGMGQYGRTLFTQSWYSTLAPELKGQINDASNPGHFNWHVYTRMNWGEPWYAGFRESQTLYRFKNQLHYSRNLMPRMLGWFALRPETTLEDAEWLLARAAGFDTGFALATSLASTAQLSADPLSAETAKRFGTIPAILEAIHQWETARRTGAFPESLKAELRDNTREFHLEPVGANQWDLYPVQAGQRGKPTRLRGKRK